MDIDVNQDEQIHVSLQKALEEIKEELAKRPNVNIDGGKAWRRWLMEYRKNKKRGS